MKAIEIVWVNDFNDARDYCASFYEPIECSFGSEGSVMGPLEMDHHGEESHREGVAIRAYRDHFGYCKSEPKFVVTGAADADATFAIAALAGFLPHPSRAAEFEKAPPAVRSAMTRDLTKLALLVNRVDTDPIGVRLEETEEGAMLLLWNQMSSSSQDATSFHAGVDRWRCLLGRAPKALLEAAKTEEQLRVAEARKAKVQTIGPLCALVESSAWGFDVWYAELAPVILAYMPGNGNVTIGCRDAKTAEKLFGPGGLKNVFSKLEPKGWGGREAVGGSPRGVKISREEALAAAVMIDSQIG